MKFNKYEKNGIVRIATEKAFKTLYEKEGYKLVKEKTNTKAETVAKTSEETTTENKVTKKDLVALCKEKGIPVEKNDTVETLKEKLNAVEDTEETTEGETTTDGESEENTPEE